MSLSAKRESLARIHGRYQRAGRPHKTRILDEFCATCGYHRKSALRLLRRPLAGPGSRARPGPKRTCDPVVLVPVLKNIWLASDQLCSKLQVPWTRRRAYRKNDNAHCEQKNWTHVRQLLGYERFGHPELVPLLNDLYGQEWSQYQNHFRPTFKLEKREKKGEKTMNRYETKPQTPYQRLLGSEAIPEAAKERLRAEHARLNPFALKKSLEAKRQNFFTALGNLDRESTKP